MAGETLQPKALVLPIYNSATYPLGTAKGNIFMSGVKLYFSDGTNVVLVTSA